MSQALFPDRRPAARAPLPLGPLLAGARARGVADGFTWLGLAAILMDDRGEALHVNPGAVELLGDLLYMEGGRLRAREPSADAAIAEAVRAALVDGVASRAHVGPKGQLLVHIAAMPAEPDDGYQLLRAVALLSRIREGGPPRH